MVSRNNTQLLEQRSALREVPHWGLRRTTMGVASVLLGTSVWLAGTNVVHADVIPNSGEGVDTGANSGTGVQTTNATVGFKPETQAIDTTNMTSVNTQHLQVRQTMNGMQKQYTQSQLPTTGDQGQQVMNVGQTQAVNAVNETAVNTQAGQQMNVQTNADRRNALLYGSEKTVSNQTAAVNDVHLLPLQKPDSDETAAFFGSGQSNIHYVGSNDYTNESDYLGHPDQFFSNFKHSINGVPTDAFAIGVRNSLASFEDQVYLPSNMDREDKWFAKVNTDPNFTLGVIDEVGGRHYIDPKSVKVTDGPYGPMEYTLDAVNMDDSGNWIKVGTWHLIYEGATKSIRVTLHTYEDAKTAGALPPLPLFVSSLDSHGNVNGVIYSGKVVASSGNSLRDASTSSEGSVYLLPVGPGQTSGEVSLSGYDDTVYYDVKADNLMLSLRRKNGSFHSWTMATGALRISNGREDRVTITDLNDTLPAYDRNGKQVGTYSFSIADGNRDPKITFKATGTLEDGLPVPLTIYGADRGQGLYEGKPLITVQPISYSQVPLSLPIKKVIVHQIDKKTLLPKGQDAVYEVVMHRTASDVAKGDFSWTHSNLTLEHVSGPDLMTAELPSPELGTYGEMNFFLHAHMHDKNRTTFNVKFGVPNYAKWAVAFPANRYANWNPYVITMAVDNDDFKPVVVPKVTVKYVDDAGQTLKTDQVHFSNQSGSVANLSYQAPTGYLIKDGQQLPHQVRSDSEGNLTWDNSTTVPSSVSGSAAVTTTVKVTKVPVVTADSQEGLRQAITFDQDRIAIVDAQHMFTDSNDGFKDKQRLSVEWNPIVVSNITGSMGTLDATGKMSTYKGTVATVSFLDLGNTFYTDKNGKQTQIAKIVRTYYDPIGDGTLKIAINPQRTGAGIDHSPFWLGATIDGDLSIAVKTAYYDQHGNLIHIGDNEDVLPITGLDHHVVGQNVIEPLGGASVMSNDSLKKVHDPQTGLMAYYPDRVTDCLLVFGGSNHGYRFGSLLNVDGTPSGAPKGISGAQEMYNLPKKLINQTMTVRHRQVTYHFVDASDGHVIHDPVVENVSWHRFNGDQDVSDFDEDKSLTMPTILIDGYALDQAVRKQLPNSISSDSNNDLDIVLPFKSTSSSATITVHVTPAIEKLDPNDPNSWPTDKDGHQLHAYDFARDLEYQVTYAPQYHQADFDRKVHASRDISFDAANRVFKFGNWKLDGNASGSTGSVTVPKGYNSTVDSTITFVNGHSLQADLNWTPSLNFDMSTWLPSGLSDVAGYSDNGLVNRVKEFISYGVTKQANRVITDPSQLPPDSNVKASDLQRTVTRVVNITDPNTQAVKSQTQTVTFKRGCELDPVTDQLVKYTNWNESSHHFDAVAVPVVDGWMPSSQVPAVDVTPDTESSTINVTYRANQQVLTVNYTDQGKPVGSFTINGVTGGSVNNLVDQISQHVPQHYTVDKGSLPTTYKFTSDAHQVINVPVSHGVTNIDPDDSGTWPSEIKRNDLFKSVSRTIKYVVPSKYVGQSAYQGLIQTVNFKRGATFDEVTRKATFGAWEVNGNPASFVQVMVPGLTGYTPDRNVVNAVTPTGDTQDSTVTVTYAPNDETQVINYVDSQTGKVIHSQNVNGKMDAMVTVTSEVPVHWQLADGQSVPTSMTLMDHPQVLTIKITHVIKPVDPDSPISWKVPGLAKHDLFKTVHRIIKYDVPSKYANQSQFNAVSQAVNFKRGATYDEVTKQVTYLPWQVDGQVSQFASVKSPVLAGYAVDQAQVAVVAPKGDDQDTTVTVQYTPQDQTWILQYVDADDQTKVVGTQELVAKTDETKSITPEVPTGWQLSSFAYVPKSIMFAPGMPTLKLAVTHSLTKLDPNNPSSWPSGITERDFKRNIKRIVKIVDPNGQPDAASTTQSVEFTRDVFWDEVAQKPTFGEWSYGGSYTFDAVMVPEQSGYAPSGNVPSLIVTPDDTDLTLTITYLAQGQSVNIMYLDHDQNIVGSQVISGKTGEVKSITYQLPQGWQVVSGQTNPQSVTFKAQNNSPINVEVEHVITPVDLNDPTKWPTDVHGHTLTKHDFDRVITRAITINEPAKNNQQTQSAEFTRSVGFDQVSHEFVFGDWSHNGKQTLPAVSVSSIAGYAINGSVPALVVTPDSQNTQVTVNYVANGQTNVYRFVDDQNNGQVVGEDRQFAGKTGQTVKLTIDLPAGYVLSKGQTLPQSYLFKASDNQPIVIHLSHQIKDASHDKDAQTTKVISRMINVKLPDGHVTTQVQSVTFSRSASRDAITGHLSYGAWNHDGQQSLPAYVQDSIQGYDNIGSAPRVTVTPNDHDLTVELGYHRQANRQIDPNDPSTWPDGLKRSDLIRDFKRVITIQAPQDGKLISGENPGTVTQTVTFMRSAEQDPTNNRIIFHAWNEPQHQFDSVVAPQYHGYDPSMTEVASVMVTPDTDPQSLHDVTISYTKQADHQIDPDDPATWPAGLKKSDVIRDVDRVVTITTPDGHDQVTKQHFTFKRHAIQDPVTDKITYQPWNEPQHQFDAVKVPTVKGYDPSVSEVPAITVTPDTVIGSKNVHVSYTKQADRQIDPHDPSTWPDGVTKDDLIREIHRTITIKTPDGHSQTITQTVTFTRGATQDPVTDKITFKPWSENGHHHFDAVPVPTLKGYTPNITEIPGIDVTPDTVLDDGDTNIEVSYTKNAPIKIDPNDPSTWPKGMTEHDLKRHIERNITITMPDGTKQTVHQSVDFVRDATQDPVTDQITFGPWSHDGKYHFDDVLVPQVKGYDSNIKQVPGIDVTPDTVLNDGDTDIQVTFTKQPDRQIDPNDPSTWPKGLTEHDFKRDIKRTVTLVKPDGTKQTITQEVVFTRGATQDPVTDKVTFGPWSENGHHHFGDIHVPQIPGYHSNVQVIPGIDVTPDTVLSDADQTIKITYRVNIKAVHDQKVVTRTINVMNPESGQVDSRVQRVTLYRDGEYDASTGNTKWESWTQSQFKSVLAPSFAGYQADLLVVPVMNVNGQTKNSVVTINYRLVKFDLGVHYVTTDGQLVGQQVIKDYTIGQDVSRLLQIPDHYAIVGDGQMTGKRTMTYQVQVIRDQPTIPDDLSSPDDIQIADWYANANDHSQSLDLNDGHDNDQKASLTFDNHTSVHSVVSKSNSVVTTKTSTSNLPKTLVSGTNSEIPVGSIIGTQSVMSQRLPMSSGFAPGQSVSELESSANVDNDVVGTNNKHTVEDTLPQTGNDQATVLALAGAGLMLGVASLGVTKQRKKRV